MRSSFISNDDRIVTIEDAAELQLEQNHIVRLETRPPNIEGKGRISATDLVRNCLRMRPDRIIIGECRGPETLDMLQAMICIRCLSSRKVTAVFSSWPPLST